MSGIFAYWVISEKFHGPTNRVPVGFLELIRLKHRRTHTNTRCSGVAGFFSKGGLPQPITNWAKLMAFGLGEHGESLWLEKRMAGCQESGSLSSRTQCPWAPIKSSPLVLPPLEITTLPIAHIPHRSPATHAGPLGPSL